MKELEKTQRLSIAAVLTILVILIALLSYKRPKHIFATNASDTLEKLISKDYLITLDDIDSKTHVLVDIRSAFEFNKGHLDNAINISIPEILSEDYSSLLNKLKTDNKTVVLYGGHPNETNLPYLLLTQLGFDNLKILTVENSYIQNKLITKIVAVENTPPDINSFVQESIKKKLELMKKRKVISKPKVAPAPKKVIPVKKKKKMPIEGGC